MNCAWKELLSLLPPRMRREVDLLGREGAQEIRLRINSPPELILAGEILNPEGTISREDLDYCINAASKYSPWAAATAAKGYLTAPGGHRVGLCGNAVVHNGILSGIRELRSLCIRVARDFPGIAEGIPSGGSILILGAPGWGKTTLLRDLCRRISCERLVSVMDERGELFPEGMQSGNRMDILSGCPKTAGLEMLLRTMGPEYIAADEITSMEDCEALIRAANCGVHLLTTAHAASMEEYLRRPVYAGLIRHRIFQTIVLLRQDKTYTLERMSP